MTFFAVLDTNVIVSAVLSRNGAPRQIFDYLVSGLVIPVINTEILAEYKDVLSRPKFPFSEETINRIFDLIISKSISDERTESKESFIDEDDRVFYKVALSAKEKQDTYLVTGNQKHIPKKSFIVMPREFLNIVEKALK